MQQFERIQKTHVKRTKQEDVSTFPEALVRVGGGGPDETDEVLNAIDQALADNDRTQRSLGEVGLSDK